MEKENNYFIEKLFNLMLSDGEILRLMEKGEIGIEPFEERNLTPNGYDLRIGEVMIPSLDIYVKREKVRIPPLTRFLVGSMEYVTLSPKYVAQIWIKSRWARRGVLASFGLVDAGFQGILTMGAFATEEIELGVGDGFAQICFIPLKEKAQKPYHARSGNYQGQKNIKI